MKKNYFFLLVLLLFLSANSLYGQQTRCTISGTVTAYDGEPLAGASVVVEELLNGVASGNDGHYEIRGLKRGTYHVRFSFTGYEPVTQITVLNDNTVLNVSLNEATILANEIVVSSTRAGNSTPMAYTNMDSSKIRQTDMTRDIPYLLSLTPSVVETSDAGTGVGYTALRVRGSEGNRINVTLDGVPLNDAESQEMFWVDLPDLASSVSSIQIQRGAGTSTNGPGAFGASLNINTLNPPKEAGGELNFSAGSFNTFRTTVKAYSGLLNDHFSMAIRASVINSDGYIKHSASDIKSAAISTAWNSAKSIIKLNILLGSERTGIAWWGVPQDSLATDRRFNPAGVYTDASNITRYYNDEVDDYLQNHYHLSFSRLLSDKLTFNSGVHLTTGKGYYEEQKSDISLEEYGLDNIIIGNTTITETDIVQRKWMTNNFYGAVWSFVRKGARSEMILGGGLNRYDGNHFGRIIWMENAGKYIPDYEWYRNKGIKDEISVYGKASTRLTASLSSYLDMQYRHIAYSITGPDDDTHDLTQDHKYDFFNPKAGLLWRNGAGSEAYISLAVTHREPSRSNLTDAAGDLSVTPRPERMADIETGYSLSTTNLIFNANFYLMKYHDQLVPTGEISNVGYSIMTNVENSYRMGVELSGSYRPCKTIGLNANLTLSRNKISNFRNYFTDYNTSDWSEAYVYKDLGTVDIAYSPDIIATGVIEIHPAENLVFRITNKYVGKQYFDNTMSEERKIDPYFISNASVDFTRKTKSFGEINMRFLVNNIYNNMYESNAYGGMWSEDGNEKTWAYFFPQAGANFQFSLGIKF